MMHKNLHHVSQCKILLDSRVMKHIKDKKTYVSR